MKRALLAVAVTLAALAGWARAGAHENRIGVYTTVSGGDHCQWSMPAAGANLTMYLLATSMTNPHGVAGYECGLDFVLPGGQAFVEPPTVTLPADWVNAAAWPNFQCAGGPSNSALLGPTIQLAKIKIANRVGEDPDTGAAIPISGLIVLLGPCSPCSFGPGTLWPQHPVGPGYADGQDPGTLYPLAPSVNIPAARPSFYAVYWAGSEVGCPDLDARADSWSRVKALYR